MDGDLALGPGGAQPHPGRRRRLRRLAAEGGLARRTLVVVVPTGSGWVDDVALDTLADATDGDVASVTVAYDDAPSWLSYLTARGEAVATTDALLAAVARHRPAGTRLVLYGQSLRALAGAQAWARHPERADGAFWVGPPADTPRDPPGGHARAPDRPRRVWSPWLLVTPPERPVARPWLPVVSFVQTSVDLLGAVGAPAGSGHHYGAEQRAGWDLVRWDDDPPWGSGCCSSTTSRSSGPASARCSPPRAGSTSSGRAVTGPAAVLAVASLRPEVVLMDVQMPGGDGLSATEEITAAHPEVRVLVVTTFDVDDYVRRALRGGASGFVLKDSDPEDLVRAVRTVHAGESLLAPSVTTRLVRDWVSQEPVAPHFVRAARGPDRAGARRAGARRPRAVERRDRRRDGGGRVDGEDPRRAPPAQAGAARPGPARRPRFRAGPGPRPPVGEPAP